MKKIYCIISLITLSVLGISQSCTNLDEELFDQVSSESFFQSDEEFVSSMGPAYTNLYDVMGNFDIFPMNEVTSDEIVIPTRSDGGWDDGGHWKRLHRHTWETSDSRIESTWSFCFSGVSSCNRLIETFESVGGEGPEKFIAELKVLRGLYYYWLIDLYGNVPIVTGFSDADPTPPTASRTEVYNFVVNDLKENIPLLSRAVDASTYGRMNYYAGQMILAKLYLNAEVYTDWTVTAYDKAVAAADEIINSGVFSLTPNYFDNFKVDNSGSPEFIFAIPYDEVFAQGFSLTAMTLHEQSLLTFNLSVGPWNGWSGMQEFYEAYDDNDIRKKSFLQGPQFESDGVTRLTDGAFEDDDPDGAPITFTPEITSLERALRQEGVRIGKWEFESGASQNMNNDFAVFRYADLLLIKAEALWRKDPGNGEALALVNQIRERAGVGPLDVLTEDALLQERGQELWAEAQRRSDLIRFGRFQDAWQFKPVEADDHTSLMPIPSSQISSNPNLIQNPGYPNK